MRRIVRIAVPAAVLVTAPFASARQCTAACNTTSASYAGVALERLCTDVDYGGNGHKCQKLDAYIVKSSVASPLIVEIHGGGFHGGVKSEFDVYLQPTGGVGVIEKALEHGISVVSLNYRLASQTNGCCIENSPHVADLANAFPAANDDVALALQFARAQSYLAHSNKWFIDPDRVVAIGGSAGGTLSMWLAMHEDLRNASAPAGSVAAQSTRVSSVVSLSGPTQFTNDFLYACPTRHEFIWYFNTTSVSVFNGTTLDAAYKNPASPAWLALQTGSPSAGWTLNGQVPILGIHAGNSSWTLSSFGPPPSPPNDCPSGGANPLWKPTSDAHSILFGLHMKSVLESIGSTVADELVEPVSGACAEWKDFASDYALDFLCRSVDFVPGDDLSSAFAGTLNGSEPVKLGGYGELRPATTSVPASKATIWVRSAPAGSAAYLLYSGGTIDPPIDLAFGKLVLDPATLGDPLPLGDADSCGHLAYTIDGGILTGSVYVQVMFVTSSGAYYLTNARELEFLP